jgi:hypothetical protein
MAERYSGSSIRRRPASDGFNERELKPKGDGSLFGWSIFILLLIGLVAVCWMGTLYIFGHPEEPMGYAMLHKFKKLEAPKRFSETAAPKGEFLDAKKLLAKYGPMSAYQLDQESHKLLRDYIRNYEGTVGLVPYITGRYNILDSYQLTKNDFIQSGVVAIAQDSEVPQVLVETIYPTDERMVSTLHRSLLTGLDIPIQRSIDLSPILHVEKLPDGRLKFTTIPIQYPNYSATQGPGSFSLEPPATLNVEAGLPVLPNARIAEADQRYASYRRKVANPNSQNAAPPANQLMPVRAATTTSGATPEPAPQVARAIPVNAPAPTPAPTPVPAAVPTTGTEPPVARAIPVNPADAPPVAPLAAAPAVGTDVPLKPFMTGTTTAVASTASGKWQTFKPGQMPRGRLVGLGESKQLAGTGLGGERVYLKGNFVVSAAGQNRAVLRDSGGAKDARIIVEFPATSSPPSEGASVTRDASRPFLITRIERSSDGTVNIWAREVTSQ